MPDRERPDPIRARVARCEWLTPAMVRIVLAGEDFARFGEPEHADAYVKLIFPHDADAADADADRPRMRTYTVRSWDRAAQELTLDVLVHGPAGLAGPWAAAARPGDEMFVRGPGGGYSPDPDADWHLLAGDESALPAIAAALERLPAHARGAAFVEVHDARDEVELTAPPGVSVTWLHRGDDLAGERLVEAVTGWAVPDGRGHCFVHGEAGAVRTLRRYLRVERGLPLEQLSISGYWRLGVDDEGWRASKRDWNRAVEESERTTASA